MTASALACWGYDEGFAAAFAELAQAGDRPARVVRAERRQVLVVEEQGVEVLRAVPQMLLRSAADAPRSGDWVVVDDRQVVRAVLPRRTQFLRRAKGHRAVPQVVVANVDVALVLMGLDGDFNLRRLERYLMLVEESGARPIVLLTKAGLTADVDLREAEVRRISVSAPVHAIDVISGINAELPKSFLAFGRTLALLGSSGVGKSTLVNHLVGGNLARTAAVRQSDDRGRHTTSRRDLYLVPEGGIVLDSPGMRELQLWGDQASLDAAFSDMTNLALGCRFSDCQHREEPGCVVRAAVSDGRLEASRLESYRSLSAELADTERSIEDRGRRSSYRPAKR